MLWVSGPVLSQQVACACQHVICSEISLHSDCFVLFVVAHATIECTAHDLLVVLGHLDGSELHNMACHWHNRVVRVQVAPSLFTILG
jgi:hypothetical protein